MSIYRIDCKNYKLNGDDKEFGDSKLVVTEDNKEIHAIFYIDCEDDTDNNSFNFEQYGDDEFVVERNRCELKVYIKENKTPYDKNFRIVCTHSNDAEVFIVIEIKQIAEEYKVMFSSAPTSVGPSEITINLKSVIQVFVNADNSNYNYYEEKKLNVCVIGGSRKYRIESILKCHEETVEGEDEPRYIYSPFDKGFIYVKRPDSLTIRNYGRQFMEQEDYYVITLCHEDYRWAKATIILKYIEAPSGYYDGEEETELQGDIQESDIYKPHDYIRDEDEESEETSKVCQLTVNGAENYEIDGQTTDDSITFSVREDNNNNSDLMVIVTSHAKWCSVTTLEQGEQRKIKITINNEPLCERKAKIVISVVDCPNAVKSFIVTNNVGS